MKPKRTADAVEKHGAFLHGNEDIAIIFLPHPHRLGSGRPAPTDEGYGVRWIFGDDHAIENETILLGPRKLAKSKRQANRNTGKPK